VGVGKDTLGLMYITEAVLGLSFIPELILDLRQLASFLVICYIVIAACSSYVIYVFTERAVFAQVTSSLGPVSSLFYHGCQM